MERIPVSSSWTLIMGDIKDLAQNSISDLYSGLLSMIPCPHLYSTHITTKTFLPLPALATCPSYIHYIDSLGPSFLPINLDLSFMPISFRRTFLRLFHLKSLFSTFHHTCHLVFTHHLDAYTLQICRLS